MGVDQFGSTTIDKVRIGGVAGTEATEDLEVVGNATIGGTLAVTGTVTAVAKDTIWAAKGDIVAATADNAAAVVTVGTDGQSLVANSGAASGVSYADRMRGNVGSTDNRIPRSDGTGTFTLQSSGITCDDSNNVSGMGTLGCGAITSSAGISGTTGAFSSTLASTGNLAVGGATGIKFININAGSDANASLIFSNNSVFEFYLGYNGTTDKLAIGRYNTSGVYQDDPISIAQSDGVTTLSKTVLFTGIRAVSATGAASAPEIAHGTYTPTLTSVANVDSTTAAVCHTTRIGNDVHIEGSLAVNVTATTTLTKVGISLPVASAFTAATDANGSGGCTNVAVTTAPEVYADATNDRLELAFTSASTGSHTIRFSVDYTVKN